MKDKIVLFIIGVLVGAVIATGAFYIYTTTSNTCNNSNQNMHMNGGEPPEMPSGQNSGNTQPPEKPDGENSQPPEMPSDNNQSNNTQGNN